MKVNEITIGSRIKQEAFFILERTNCPYVRHSRKRTDYEEKEIVVSERNISFILENIESYSGIPLTEELVLDFGLKKMPISEYTLDTYDLLGFKLWMNKGKFLFQDKIEIEFVHQLQILHSILKK
jgi:hypothetical protein